MNFNIVYNRQYDVYYFNYEVSHVARNVSRDFCFHSALKFHVKTTRRDGNVMSACAMLKAQTVLPPAGQF